MDARLLTGKELIWFKDRGVSVHALAGPPPLMLAKVSFFSSEALDLFDFDAAGTPALLIEAQDRGEAIDFVAWQPKTGRLASLCGTAFCIGDIDDVWNPAVYFPGGALRVHREPLAWLQAGREGIVILKPKFARAYLHQAQRIECTDTALAANLDRWLRPPKHEAKIICRKEAA